MSGLAVWVAGWLLYLGFVFGVMTKSDKAELGAIRKTILVLFSFLNWPYAVGGMIAISLKHFDKGLRGDAS